MKRMRLMLLPVLALAVSLSAAAQSGKCLPSRTDGVAPYTSGEQLTFSIFYNWHGAMTAVAKADLSVKGETLNGEKVMHSALSVKTASFFDVFFKIREQFESWFVQSGTALKPRQFLRDSREGNYHAVNRYKYDAKAGRIHAVLEYRDEGEQSVEIPYGDCTTDVTTLFYAARQLDYGQLKEGKVFHNSLAIDSDVMDVRLTYLGKENKYVKGIGTVVTRKFGLSVRKGEMFSGEQDVIMWFSDDDNRIPVAFMAPLKVGQMDGALKSYNGLSHPFDALVSSKRVK